MRAIKRQLKAYYSAKGVGRRRAEKLVKSDLAAADRYAKASRCLAEFNEARHTRRLSSAFVWAATPQGHQYWRDRDVALGVRPALPAK